jgi:hypothetical protein
MAGEAPASLLIHPVDAGGIAARRREMNVQIGCSLISESALDRGFEIPSLNQVPSHHHRFGVKGTYGQGAATKLDTSKNLAVLAGS